MAAYERSDPKKLAADREAIRQQVEGFERVARVKRSQAKAQADAEAYKLTGEGTLKEAWGHLLDEAANKRYVKKYGGPPTVEGAAQIGFRKSPTDA